MGFRFQKRIRIFKGLTLNLSKSGTSWTLGGRRTSVNVRGNKVTGTVGVPGTGLSYRETLSEGSQTSQPEQPQGAKVSATRAKVMLQTRLSYCD